MWNYFIKFHKKSFISWRIALYTKDTFNCNIVLPFTDFHNWSKSFLLKKLLHFSPCISQSAEPGQFLIFEHWIIWGKKTFERVDTDSDWDLGVSPPEAGMTNCGLCYPVVILRYFLTAHISPGRNNCPLKKKRHLM